MSKQTTSLTVRITLSMLLLIMNKTKPSLYINKPSMQGSSYSLHFASAILPSAVVPMCARARRAEACSEGSPSRSRCPDASCSTIKVTAPCSSRVCCGRAWPMLPRNSRRPEGGGDGGAHFFVLVFYTKEQKQQQNKQVHQADHLYHLC